MNCFSLQLGCVLILLSLCGCGKHTMTEESVSMEPTIQRGEKITVDTTAYRAADPARWEVILFKPPVRDEVIWAHRIVGMPNEVVSFTNDAIYINDQPLPLPNQLAQIKYAPAASNFTNWLAVPHPYRVPAGSYYVLGDNAAFARDSRFYGAIPREAIVGKVIGK